MKDLTIFGRIDEDLEETVQLLKKNNVGVVIRDEHELNSILIQEAKERSVVTANAKSKGKEKATSSNKGTNWDEEVQELKRLNATHLFRWGSLNKIVVHSPSWKMRVWIDTMTFKAVMESIYNDV